MKPQDKMHDMMMSIEKQMLYKSVSLSWWLSPPLQAYLDGQLYTRITWLNEIALFLS